MSGPNACGGARWSVWALLGGAALGAASPPLSTPLALAPLLLGLMLWFTIATASPRPGRHAYLFGCAHMLWFSWSVRHFAFAGLCAIVLVGGLYYLLAARVTRAAPRWQGTVFAVATAGSFWLRAGMPEIHYPHGQPCHSLWTLPVLLAPITVGGEAFVNALLAALAATLVQLVRSWRTAVPAWGRSLRAVAITVGIYVASAVLGTLLQAACAGEGSLRLAAIEPGFHPQDEWIEAQRRDDHDAWLRLFEERYLVPSERELAVAAPDLLVWPESSLPEVLRARDIDAGRARLGLRGLDRRLRLVHAGPTRLVLGAEVEGDTGETPAACIVDLKRGQVLGYQQKRVLVPAGEFVPFVGLMPAALRSWLQTLARQTFHQELPACVPGAERPPLAAADGTRFGTLRGYDNAYPAAAAAQVAAGARLLLVLSNESWFRGGNELDQLVAMTVCRALETATPLVRCTQDGCSVVVGADGRRREQLPVVAGRQPAARILRAEVPLGAGHLPAMAWTRAAAGPLAGLGLGLWFLHSLVRRARLRSAPPAFTAAAGPGPSGAARGSGS